jgi:poly(3-hydroxyalkanoate) synthetase
MSEITLVLAGACIGGAFTLLWALGRVEAVVESHRSHTMQIQMRHNRELKAAYKDRDDLETQADSLLDPDWWKEAQ